MKNVLFVCSQNRLRSPTAEQVFSKRRDIEVESAGTNHDADNPLTHELVTWA
ncbi:protein tyrosine phosphatase, partial [Mesorhizobium sp. M1D.F.Ca.ET.234.01.1.1]